MENNFEIHKDKMVAFVVLLNRRNFHLGRVCMDFAFTFTVTLNYNIGDYALGQTTIFIRVFVWIRFFDADTFMKLRRSWIH